MATHEGGCHCGSVRWTAETEITRAISCNCSICRKRGSLLHFIGEKDFVLRQGADGLTDYQWNKRVIHHLFCKTCGVASFARGQLPDGTPMVALNIRCIEALDLDTVEVVGFDGASL